MADVLLPETGLDEHQHGVVASGCFQHVMTMLDMASRSPAEDRFMLEVAEASRLHSRFVSGAVDSARAAWLLSRVLVTLGRGEESLAMAEECLEVVKAGRLGPLDEAFGLEAVARAQSTLGNVGASASARADGESLAVQVDSDVDRERIRGHLATVSEARPH